jgi:O-6-methylguanine DNA methyltransferase
MGETVHRSTLDSPLGPSELVSTASGLAAIGLGDELDRHEHWIARTFPEAHTLSGTKVHREIARQIAEYFDGRRRVFDLPLDLRGSAFQKSVWAKVASIPYGKTASYSEIAHLVGRPRAFRAVGAANGANPIPLVIPCHRVLGADGSLIGYGGGLDKKRWLLIHEGVLLGGPSQMSLFAGATATAPP